jgi:nucleoside-diphosphate-sugar epimerase
MKTLVTGDGFVGSALTDKLSLIDKIETINAVRTKKKEKKNVITLEVGDIAENLIWTPFLVGVNVVIHTVARVHVMSDQSSNPIMEYRRVNVEGLMNFARQAAELGVQRFIFLSSIKVNGEQTDLGKSFTSNETHIPEDAYGLSKYEAEQGLLKLAKETDMEVVIIRPPLVYGPGVKANFASLIKFVKKGLPLPLGAINNKRSLIAIDNLVDFISLCADRERSPQAANQVFVVSDD